MATVISRALAERTDDLRSQVACDRVVGLGTLGARYGLARPDMMEALRHHGISTTMINVAVVRGRPSSYGAYRVAYLGERPRSTHAASAHYAITADMRLQADAQPADWRHAGTGNWDSVSDGARSGRGAGDDAQFDTGTQPDAYWRQRNGTTINVEADATTYSDATITRKLLAAMMYGRVTLWGAPTAQRLHRVRDLAAAANRLRADHYRHHNLTYVPIEVRLMLVCWHVGSQA